MDMTRKADDMLTERTGSCLVDTSNEPLATWRKLISIEMKRHGDAWGPHVVSCTLSDAELDTEFFDGYGVTKGKPFTLWTASRVYFPASYDGSEWVGSVSREPDGVATPHVGEWAPWPLT